jgi:hypothetical protein
MKFGYVDDDPANDFCVEVECIEGMACNRRVGFDPEPTLEDRVSFAIRML